MTPSTSNASVEQGRDRRIAIIGCGTVGTTCAYSLLQNSLVRELILVGRNFKEAEGEAMDLQHAVPLGTPVKVMAGTYKEAARSSIAILTAGAPNQPGESRLDLLEKNLKITRECVGKLMNEGWNGILLVATNPVDVLALAAQRESGLPACQVIGSGTVIDTIRLRAILGAEFNIDARAVHAFIIGEHGDSSVAVWSTANIAGIPLQAYKGADKLPPPKELLKQVRQAGPDVVERKGNTCFAIASCITRICEAILRNERAVLPVSTLMEGQYGGLTDVYLSTPCIVGSRGIEQVLELPLSQEEHQDLRTSAKTLQEAAAEKQ